MPDLDLDSGADSQDGAETFDETLREDELDAADGDFDDNPDIAGDVYDVTSALGDADDDDGVQYEMDAASGVEGIDDDDLEEDEDEDDQLDDDFEDEPEDDDIDDEDDPVDIIAGRAAPSEPGLAYVADVDGSTNPRDDETEKYESTRPLSDAQLDDLGYLNTQDIKTSHRGSGARAEDVLDESDPDDEDRLDEGLEETFPASDPVSAKHIT
jgi:hypothetical protein